MIASKHITKIVSIIMVLSICLCLCGMGYAGQLSESHGITMEYESALFDTSEIIDVNICMSESDWEEMLQNAISEEYYRCDVQINGTTYYSVGIRPKGNTSLSSIASDPDTDRYSFKLEFDHFIDGQTCFGLDKLVLNNNYADATNMKEALVYDMFQYLDADASLYNYAKISVNGEYWGIYLALEAVDDSFLLRNYGVQTGELYKPEGTGGGGMGGGQKPNANGNQDMMQLGNNDNHANEMTPPQMGGEAGQMPNMNPDDGNNQDGINQSFPGGQPSEDFQRPQNDNNFGEMPNKEKSIQMSGNGADLNYTDDDLDSYSTIWDCEVTNTNDADHKRVVKALKNIFEGNDLETYMDIDNLLKYMAVHIFSVNADSLSGTMAHNYYLYESDGMLNIIPWDYNLSLGGMNGGTATSVVNSAIDEAFTATTFFDSLMENEEYHERYYAYLQQLVNEYLRGDGFVNFYTRTRSQIDALVESDPNALYTYSEYTTAVETLQRVVMLRGDSIDGQINGTIPSTQQAQKNTDSLIDASNLDISAMGTMNHGGFDAGNRKNEGALQVPGQAPSAQTDMKADAATGATSNNQDFGGDASSDGFDPSQIRGQMHGMQRPDVNIDQNQGASARTDTMILYGISGIVMLSAFLFAVFFRRRPRKR